MSAPPNVPQFPPVDPTVPPNPAELTEACVHAATSLARKAAAAGSAAEGKDFANAVLQLTQALVIMDPALSANGTPLAHEVAVENIRAQGAVDVERQRGENAASAPTPVRSVQASVSR